MSRRGATHITLSHVVKADCQFDAQHPVPYIEAVPVASAEPVPGLHGGAG